MSTRRKGNARAFLEELVGPLNFANMLEAIRLGEEMSQVDFAKLLKISPSHLCDIEKGRKVVSPDRAARFAAILGHSEAQFVRLALQHQLDQAGLKFQVDLKAS